MTRHLRILLLLLACLLGLGAPAAAAATTDPVGVWPLTPQPEVVRGFEPPSSPYGPGHRGVDLLGRVGQPVRAALPGTVSFAGRLAGRGVVVVGHGPTRTTYEPVLARVTVGDEVAAGDRLGSLEYAGGHCAPAACLHWGWVGGETYLDPLRLVGAGPVRLLPLWREQPVDPPPGAVPPVRPVQPYAGWQPTGLLWLDLVGSFRLAGAPAGRPAAAVRW